jgi:tRNA threonylcarbamoyladenosine biosynthesis protein TsaE
MGSFTASSAGVQETYAIAGHLAHELRIGDVVLLKGGLASGKTTFVKAIARALASPDVVTSPTFTLAHFYAADAGTILHIDAYRLSGIHEYRDLGLADYVDESITLVEWGESIAEDYPCHLMIEFQCQQNEPNVRMLTISSGCDRWRPVMERLRAVLPDAEILARNSP